jgi:hypothetical protein
MSAKIGNLKTMLLSLNSGSQITSNQKKWLLNWIKQNLKGSEIDKAAEIAYQYDYPDEIIDEIKKLK